MMARSTTLQSKAGYIDARPLATVSSKSPCIARPDHTLSQTGSPSDFFGGLGAASTGVQLLATEGATQLKFEGNAALNFAAVTATATGAGLCWKVRRFLLGR
jgi:hypothetical protein